MSAPDTLADQVHAALATVSDPEIRRPITEIGMVKAVQTHPDGSVDVAIYLTIAACPLKDRLTADVTEAVSRVTGVTAVLVYLYVMSE